MTAVNQKAAVHLNMNSSYKDQWIIFNFSGITD